MSENPMIESIAPDDGANIVDKDAAISDPQKRAATPTIQGAKDLRKTGVEVITSRGAKTT